MRADKDLTGASKEAAFLIAVATEEFIKRLAQSGHKQARQEGRLTIQIRDLAVAVQQHDELNFLEDIIPLTVPTSIALEKHKEKVKERNPPIEGPGSITEHFNKVPKAAASDVNPKAAKGKGKAATVIVAATRQADDGDVDMDVTGLGERPPGVVHPTADSQPGFPVVHNTESSSNNMDDS